MITSDWDIANVTLVDPSDASEWATLNATLIDPGAPSTSEWSSLNATLTDPVVPVFHWGVPNVFDFEEPPVLAARGSQDVGTTTYSVPVGALFVDPVSGSDSNPGTVGSPKATVAAAITAATTGATIVLRAGSYPEQVSIPSNKVLTIQSYPNEAVWFEGTDVVTGWTGSGPWTRSSWTTEFDRSTGFAGGSSINPSYPLAAYPDGIYVDDVALTQVATTGAVVAGTFCADYTANTLTIGDNPSGKTIRVRTRSYAIRVASAGSVARGLGVRRYATSVNTFGSVQATGADVTFENLVVDDSATIGISCQGARPIVNRVTVTGAGLLGIHSNHADGQAYTNCIINNNNTQRFNSAPVAGGIKITRARGALVDNCQVDGNIGNGIWLDESVLGFQVSNCLARNNTQTAAGIEAELCEDGLIVGNIATGNASKGIFIYNTGNVQVFNNLVAGNGVMDVQLLQDERRQATASTGQDERYPIPDPLIPWLTEDIVLSNNMMAAGGPRSMWAQDLTGVIDPDDMNIDIVGNFLRVDPPSGDVTLVWVEAGPSYAFYRTKAAIEGKNATYINSYATGNVSAATMITEASTRNSEAVALPAEIAAILFAATGAKFFGPTTNLLSEL